MKLPSFNKLLSDAGETLARFPFVIASGVLGTMAVLSRTDDPRYALVGFLGISFLYAVSIFAERRTSNRLVRLGAGVAGAALLAVYFFTLPRATDLRDVEMMRYLLFALGTHLLAAFAPYIRRGEANGFWQYNKTLFIRFLATQLYAGVLYLGLSLALLALEKLFNVDIGSRIYGDLFAVLGGIFSTWFFLAGIPTDLSTLDGVDAYPQGLKIFTQYVLLPLVAIYLIILYIYSGKILLAWQLPIGWVSMLVLGFAVVGILSLLLLYPIRNREGNDWIRRFNAWFYWLLAPLLVLLFLAICRRIGDYGITEPRYFVIALSVWLAGITLYFIIGRHDNIRIIPISLAVAVLISSFGPWSAFNMAVRSQEKRLHDLLVAQKLLVNEKIAPAGATAGNDPEYRVHSIIEYLDRRNRLNDLRDWFPKPPAEVTSDTLLVALGLDNPNMPGKTGNPQISISGENERVLDVHGFDYAVYISPAANFVDTHAVIRDSLKSNIDAAGSNVRIWMPGGDTAVFNVAAFAGPLADSLIAADANRESFNSYRIPDSRLRIDGTWNGQPARLLITTVALTALPDKRYHVESLDGVILFTAKKVVPAVP